MYVSHLRKFVMADLPTDMRQVYDQVVEPSAKAKSGHAPEDAIAVRKSMQPVTFYRTWSSLPYNAQEMTWQSVEDEVERALPDLITVADQAAKQSPAGGSLRLNPELEIPKAVSALDIHLMPGCFHTEFADNDGFRWCNLCPWHKSVFGRSENAAQSWKGRCC